MEERHMEYKDNFQRLQTLLDAHQGCRLLQPNRSLESMEENLICMHRNSCTGMQEIISLFRRVYEYINVYEYIHEME